MRRIIGLVVILGSIPISAAPAIAGCRGKVGGAECEQNTAIVIPGHPPSGTPRPVGVATTETIYYPAPSTGSDGQPCIRAVPQTWPAPAPQLERDWAAELWEELLTTGPRCPGSQAVPVVSPRVLALSFWQDIPLPTPAPSIAPGWAITGKPSFLETHGERSHTYSQGTPFGPLELTATGGYLVDWGDGTTTGPYAIEGAPWPDGRITHTYIDVGHYDVVVTEEWSATWRLGDESGALGGLRTVGRIDDFRVEQVQAVVSAG